MLNKIMFSIFHLQLCRKFKWVSAFKRHDDSEMLPALFRSLSYFTLLYTVFIYIAVSIVYFLSNTKHTNGPAQEI